ncbi:MAG: Crp/Fnr family transcriptional regulator [Prevotella sp.]|nr:Crp/Fnr family transcriptional regulator [Prevotella sp.]
MNLPEKEFDKTEIAKSLKILWEPLADEQRELLIDNVSILQLERNEVLFTKGDTPKYLYFLVKGKISIRREGVGGQQQIVQMVEPGAMFGYAAAIEGRDYYSTAIAGNKTTVFLIPISLTIHFIWENSDIAMLFLKEMASLLSLSVDRTLGLTQRHIRGRLANTLLTMKDKYGVEDDGLTLAIYLSREDLALMSNMTTSNAIRTLSTFASEGVISLEGRKIKFTDIEKLQMISERG